MSEIKRITLGEGTVKVSFLEGSYAQHYARQELAGGEAAISALQLILGRPVLPLTLDLGHGDAGNQDTVFRDLQPDSPGASVAAAVVRHSISRMFPEGEIPRLFQELVANWVELRVWADDSLPKAPANEESRFFGTLISRGRGRGMSELFQLLSEGVTFDLAFESVYRHSLDELYLEWQQSRLRPRPIRTLWRFLKNNSGLVRPFLANIVAILACVALGAFLTVLPAALMKGLQGQLFQLGSDRGQSGFCDDLVGWISDFGGPGGVYGVLILSLFASFLLTRQRMALTVSVVQRILGQVQLELFDKLLTLGHRFYSRTSKGEVLSLFSMDIMAVSGAIQQLLGNVLYNSVIAIVVLFDLITAQPLIGFFVLVIVLLTLAAYPILFRKLNDLSIRRRENANRVLSGIQETYDGHTTLEAFGGDGFWRGVFSKKLNSLVDTDIRLGALSATLGSLAGVTTALCLGTVVFFLIVAKVNHHPFSGDLLAFITLVTQLVSSLGGLTGIGQSLSQSAVSTERLLAVQGELSEFADVDGALEVGALGRSIEFKDVAFGYTPDRQIFTGLNLSLEAGKHYAIVGNTGGGKSTIARLLLRYRDPGSGFITFDGIDIRKVKLASLRAQASVVFQDSMLFNVSVLDNIRMGDSRISPADVEEAAKASQIHERILALSQGYKTVIDEGIQFSGGERQRLALARALVRRPSMLVLDEATSALDAVVEADVLDSIDRIARGRTVFSITHHWTAAARADEIISLVDGNIVERGSHDQLRVAGGFYQSLYEEQTRPRASKLSVDVLRKLPLFALLGPDALRELRDSLSPLEVSTGEYVLLQGTPADRYYVVGAGQVAVLVSQNGKEEQVRTIGAGEAFGENSLVPGGVRSASIRAEAPTTLFWIGGEVLNVVLNSSQGA